MPDYAAQPAAAAAGAASARFRDQAGGDQLGLDPGDLPAVNTGEFGDVRHRCPECADASLGEVSFMGRGDGATQIGDRTFAENDFTARDFDQVEQFPAGQALGQAGMGQLRHGRTPENLGAFFSAVDPVTVYALRSLGKLGAFLYD